MIELGPHTGNTEFELIKFPRCECMVGFKSWSEPKSTKASRERELWQCQKRAVWRHVSGRLFCGAHHAAWLNKLKPVLLIPLPKTGGAS